jgi:hypothetical protein
MANTSRPVGVDLFAGAGGFSLGFEQAGFTNSISRGLRCSRIRFKVSVPVPFGRPLV